MASLQHRRRHRTSLHHGNRLRYSYLNDGRLTKLVEWRRENNECCEEKTILWRSAGMKIKNKGKKKNVWNWKFCVGFSHSCVWAWVWSWMRENQVKCLRLDSLFFFRQLLHGTDKLKKIRDFLNICHQIFDEREQNISKKRSFYSSIKSVELEKPIIK